MDNGETEWNKLEVLSLFYGKHETQVSEGGECDLNKYFKTCEKNPGHHQLIAIHDLSVDHLPESYRDEDIVKLIKATADLTVRVAVRLTSKDRPEFWPDTEIPYPFSGSEACSGLRTGTGMVSNVYQYTEDDAMGACTCQTCKESETPSKTWGKVRIYTARHVVFDGLEASQTACRFFYDCYGSQLVVLDGWVMIRADIDKDWSVLECATCDLDLLDKLDGMADHWEALWGLVDNKYLESRHEAKLNFIVSHPHGCPKHVSVGRWIDRYVVKEDSGRVQETRYTYSTCTCPGSSGAYVHALGFDDWLSPRHVHGGVNSQGTNFSATGRDHLV